MLELGAFLVIAAALVSDLARATPSRALHSEIDVRNVVTEQEELLGAWVARLLARLADQGRLDARAHAPRRAARRPGRAGARSARARACAAWPSRRCCTTSASCRCRTRSSPRPAPLTPAEFAVIKRHPGDGATLLEHIGGFAAEAAARARPSRAPRRQRLSRRPARRRAVARAAHPGRLRRLRRAHERARLPPRLRRVAGARDPRPGQRQQLRLRTCSTRSPAWSAWHRSSSCARPPEAPSELPGRGGARQQRRERVGDRRPGDHAADGVGDRQVDARLARERRQRGRRVQPLATIPTSRSAASGATAAREQLAGGAVARVPARCRSRPGRPGRRGPRRCADRRRAPQPRRVISARPRVISAARALSPKPMPSEMPAAIPITFLAAPHSCTPRTSAEA